MKVGVAPVARIGVNPDVEPAEPEDAPLEPLLIELVPVEPPLPAALEEVVLSDGVVEELLAEDPPPVEAPDPVDPAELLVVVPDDGAPEVDPMLVVPAADAIFVPLPPPPQAAKLNVAAVAKTVTEIVLMEILSRISGITAEWYASRRLLAAPQIPMVLDGIAPVTSPPSD